MIAVSYTHLDVYKRQDDESPSEERQPVDPTEQVAIIIITIKDSML